jgi:hypothetical protein
MGFVVPFVAAGRHDFIKLFTSAVDSAEWAMLGKRMPGCERKIFAKLQLVGGIKFLSGDSERSDLSIRRLCFIPGDCRVLDRHRERIGLFLHQKIEPRFMIFQLRHECAAQLIGGGGAMDGETVEVRTQRKLDASCIQLVRRCTPILDIERAVGAFRHRLAENAVRTVPRQHGL